jgi:dTDP-4-amino-4,6-dideoxygalactose transaminase
MSLVRFSDLNWQYNQIKKGLLDEIELVLESGSYTSGKNVELLEKKLCVVLPSKIRYRS